MPGDPHPPPSGSLFLPAPRCLRCCPWLCRIQLHDPRDCHTPGLPVPHVSQRLPKLTSSESKR